MTATPLGAIISDAAEESETESDTSTSLNPPTELNIATETDLERGCRKRRFKAFG